MGSRLTWPQIKQSDAYRGLWVALDGCRYDARTAQPVDGVVVDADEDLVALCNRMQAGDSRHCAILFCDDEEALTPPSPALPPPRPRISSSPPSERSMAH
jgi:hypothetical protein